jgi:hypothetical protein
MPDRKTGDRPFHSNRTPCTLSRADNDGGTRLEGDGSGAVSIWPSFPAGARPNRRPGEADRCTTSLAAKPVRMVAPMTIKSQLMFTPRTESGALASGLSLRSSSTSSIVSDA